MLQIEIFEKYFYFSPANFNFDCQDLVHKIIYSSSNSKNYYPEVV